MADKEFTEWDVSNMKTVCQTKQQSIWPIDRTLIDIPEDLEVIVKLLSDAV